MISIIYFFNYGYYINKITIIPSCADVNKIKPLPKENNWFIRRHGLHDKFVILYSGNQVRSQDFQTILDASLLLKENKKIVFLFIGNGYNNQLIGFHLDGIGHECCKIL